MNTKIQTIVEAILGLIMFIFGLNKFIGFIPVEPPSNLIAQQFLGAMFSTYLFKVVAIGEIIGGILLIIPKTKFAAWLILLPIIFNIIAFHIAHDFIGNGIWLVPTLLFIIVGYMNKENIKSLIQ